MFLSGAKDTSNTSELAVFKFHKLHTDANP